MKLPLNEQRVALSEEIKRMKALVDETKGTMDDDLKRGADPVWLKNWIRQRQHLLDRRVAALIALQMAESMVGDEFPTEFIIRECDRIKAMVAANDLTELTKDVIKLENSWTLEPLKSGYILRNGPGTVMRGIAKILAITGYEIEFVDPGDCAVYKERLTCRGEHKVDEKYIELQLAKKGQFRECFKICCAYCDQDLGWYCPSPESPDHVCHYDNEKDPAWDSCIYCGQPDERK